MKVLCIINSLGTGGAEKLVLETLPLFNEKIQVDALLLQSGEYPFEQQLREKLPHQVFTSKYKGVYNPLHVFTIARHLRHYDVVHVHLFPAQYFVVLAKLLAFYRGKLIYTEHSTSNRRMRNRLLKYVDALVYSVYIKIIAISPKVDEVLKAYLTMKPTKFQLINNGVNLNKISMARSKKKEEVTGDSSTADKKMILQVSSFHHPKDQLTVIKSLKFLDDEVVVVFAGEGLDKQKAVNFAKENQLLHRVHFLGVRTDIPQLLKTADIVVLSSHYEGLSLASIEGMASGKPFIASDVPGLREVVHGAGLLFADNDAEALAKHITNLLADKAYYNKIAAQCLERAQDYDIQHMIDQHLKLYHEVNQA